MIKTFHAKNYGCLVDVTAHLTPLHAFIGPNDSGKSTILNGLRTLVQVARELFVVDASGKILPFDSHLLRPTSAVTASPDAPSIRLACSVEGGAYEYESQVAGDREALSPDLGKDGPDDRWRRRDPQSSQGLLSSSPVTTPVRTALLAQLRAARLVRFDPDTLRSPSGLIPEAAGVVFHNDRGRGLAGIYFAIRNRNDDAFATIVADVRRHFPTIKNLRVKAVTSAEVALEAELTTGARVDANRMSEGLLYYLAFAALRHIDPVSLLLVEEPENGLHPARITEVMKILRAIVDETDTQVLLATHSPLVVNELCPEEVSVVTRDDTTGTKVTRIHETPDFAERSKIYALGELWIAYANGEDEAPLLTGTEP
ncbi:MAG: ATP-binding protein [Polyangiaceae bacterium]